MAASRKKKATKKAKAPAWVFKKGSGKKAGYTWRKGYTTSTGKRVRGRWVKSAKKGSSKKKATSRKRNPSPRVVRLSKRVHKTAPKGYDAKKGKYAILTLKNTVAQMGGKKLIYKDLSAARNALATMRRAGKTGYKLVRVDLSKAAPKKNPKRKPAKRRVARRRVARKPAKRKASRRRSKNPRSQKYKQLIKRLGL